jgi:hypothetical protein
MKNANVKTGKTSIGTPVMFGVTRQLSKAELRQQKINLRMMAR